MTLVTKKSIISMDNKEYHINVSPGDIAENVIICGDPARTKKIADHWQESNEISFNREYRIFVGKYHELPIAACSTGIGAPSTAIGVEELYRCGARKIVRVGTSGSLQPEIPIGGIVNCIAAIRDEGTSLQYVPLNFPAVATPDIVLSIRQAAKKHLGSDGFKRRYFEGIGHSKDAFYSETPNLIPDTTVAEKWKTWIRSGAMATEMENSVLFVLGSLRRGLQVGAIAAIIGSTHDTTPIVDPKAGVGDAIKIALEALRNLPSNN